MKLHCPRCDVEFQKDLARCPGCGWDFRAHHIPDGFLKPPIDYKPLRELPGFLLRDAALVWVNGISVQVLWAVATLIILRIAWVILRLLLTAEYESMMMYLPGFAMILGGILLLPVWANYLFSLLRRYRYNVPVPLFYILPPRGRSLYGESGGWGIPCLIAGLLLIFLLIVPGVMCLFMFMPMLLLIRLDKRNLSSRRRIFIMGYAFKKLFGMLFLTSFILSIGWGVIGLLAYLQIYWLVIVLIVLYIPAQAALAMILYETILGRENLDVDW